MLRWIDGKNPMQYEFDFSLWTSSLVGELVQREFSVTLSLGVDRCDARAPEPEGAKTIAARLPARSGRSSDGSVTRIRQAGEENADIFFWDESDFRADSVRYDLAAMR